MLCCAGVQILLLGAPGSGKSSLVYTYWRSLTDAGSHADTDRGASHSGSQSPDEAHTEHEVNATPTPPAAASQCVEQLEMDWNFLEYSSGADGSSLAFELDMEASEQPTVRGHSLRFPVPCYDMPWGDTHFLFLSHALSL
jgi:GTPase SAR1 family protein